MDEFEDDEAFCNDADADEIVDINDDFFTEEVIDDMNDVQLTNFDNNYESIRDDSSFLHREHNDEVFCVCFNPTNSNIVASGGKDDMAIVWHSSTQKIIFSCIGHKESIVAISFSSDGSLLATGDLNGLIKVWKVATGLEIWSFEVEEIQWFSWHHKASFLLAGTSDGSVWLWHVPFSQTRTLPSHGSPSTCGKFMPDGKQACSGYSDGIIRIWDLKNITFICSVDTRIKDIESSILCIDVHAKGHLVIGGSTDGSAVLINPLNGQILSRYSHKSKETGREDVAENDGIDDSTRIESVAFSPHESCHNYVCTGSGQGVVNVWDISTHSLRHSLAIHEADIIKIRWHPTQPLVMSASADGSVLVRDARNGEGVSELLGHEGPILDFDVSSDGNHVVSCGEDQSVRIFQTIKLN